MSQLADSRYRVGFANIHVSVHAANPWEAGLKAVNYYGANDDIVLGDFVQVDDGTSMPVSLSTDDLQEEIFLSTVLMVTT